MTKLFPLPRFIHLFIFFVPSDQRKIKQRFQGALVTSEYLYSNIKRNTATIGASTSSISSKTQNIFKARMGGGERGCKEKEEEGGIVAISQASKEDSSLREKRRERETTRADKRSGKRFGTIYSGATFKTYSRG